MTTLLEKLRAATGGDREIDALIEMAGGAPKGTPPNASSTHGRDVDARPAKSAILAISSEAPEGPYHQARAVP